MAKRLQEILTTREDCAIDISGGTDAALFAAGMVCRDTPVFTYSRKRNWFFEIQNAPYARSLPCSVKLDAKSCFLMAGGNLLPGREDNARLSEKAERIGALFDVFMEHRKIWMRQISYIQKISSAEPGDLAACGPRTLKADRSLVTVSEDFLVDLSEAHLIRDLIISEEQVSFSFYDETERFWLRDIGSVLELQVYRAALMSGCFQDVVLSAVVNWEGGKSQRNAVTNEIDVVAVTGVTPFFISCKTGDIRTEALNELAVLRDRFGGKSARAMIVTSRTLSAHSPVRKRAAELNIEVADLEELELPILISRLSGAGETASRENSRAGDPFMEAAIREARTGINLRHGGPFGCVIVKDGKIVGSGHNMVLADHDSTAHGEIVAIRDAEKRLGTHDLSGCTLYTTGEPCHMCLTAILWANIGKVYYGCRIRDNAMIGFRDETFDNLFEGRDKLGDLMEMSELDREACLKLFREYLETDPGRY